MNDAVPVPAPAGRSPLADEIRRQAALHPCGLSFEDFMALALYHPSLGYYSRPRPIGRRGDYFTSVSVGSCFGELLARQIRQIHAALGAPAPFCVIEQGAHSGELARDILRAWPGLPYRIVEPHPALRQLQSRLLAEFQPAVQHVENLRELGETTAVFLCNELLDSFPVRRLHFTGQHWEEWRVVAAAGPLQFQLQRFALEQTGLALPAWVPSSAPAGFNLEFCPALPAWVAGLTSAVRCGVALVIDYGLTRKERLAPERRAGTLRAYRAHRPVEDPLENPGETDLTWHADFTTVIEEALRLGWQLAGFTDQHRFLTGVAADWLRSLEGQAGHPLMAQFKTLTHPGLLGRSFRVLALSRNTGPLRLDGFRFAPPPGPAQPH